MSRGHERSRRQSRHFAVAHVEFTAATQRFLNGLNGRHRHGIVGGVAAQHGRGQGHAERIENRRGDIQLGPRGIVLAVAELQESAFGNDLGVGIDGGGVNAVRPQVGVGYSGSCRPNPHSWEGKVINGPNHERTGSFTRSVDSRDYDG